MSERTLDGLAAEFGVTRPTIYRHLATLTDQKPAAPELRPS